MIGGSRRSTQGGLKMKITSIAPQLMFEGAAEEAMHLYTSTFADSEIESLVRYAAGEQGAEGTVKQASFRLGGQRIRCIDSPIAHEFTFTPAISLFVELDTMVSVDDAFVRLSEGGAVLMELDAYPFSQRFGWLADRFGVSWQLSLA
jgi:predicted 3-demethylubiquinone-9 3-methyltransferase (glyoxalase superfamily)